MPRENETRGSSGFTSNAGSEAGDDFDRKVEEVGIAQASPSDATPIENNGLPEPKASDALEVTDLVDETTLLPPLAIPSKGYKVCNYGKPVGKVLLVGGLAVGVNIGAYALATHFIPQAVSAFETANNHLAWTLCSTFVAGVTGVAIRFALESRKLIKPITANALATTKAVCFFGAVALTSYLNSAFLQQKGYYANINGGDLLDVAVQTASVLAVTAMTRGLCALLAKTKPGASFSNLLGGVERRMSYCCRSIKSAICCRSSRCGFFGRRALDDDPLLAQFLVDVSAESKTPAVPMIITVKA